MKNRLLIVLIGLFSFLPLLGITYRIIIIPVAQKDGGWQILLNGTAGRPYNPYYFEVSSGFGSELIEVGGVSYISYNNIDDAQKAVAQKFKEATGFDFTSAEAFKRAYKDIDAPGYAGIGTTKKYFYFYTEFAEPSDSQNFKWFTTPLTSESRVNYWNDIQNYLKQATNNFEQNKILPWPAVPRALAPAATPAPVPAPAPAVTAASSALQKSLQTLSQSLKDLASSLSRP